jgi:hypothetical protein
VLTFTATILKPPEIPLNNPFQRLFEFAQPGSSFVLSGVPNRTSYELQLAAELSARYWSALAAATEEWL